jgi:hypothetical protein
MNIYLPPADSGAEGKHNSYIRILFPTLPTRHLPQHSVTSLTQYPWNWLSIHERPQVSKPKFSM